MNFSLDISITANSQDLINAIKNQLPNDCILSYGSEENNKSINEALGNNYKGLYSLKSFITFDSDNDRIDLVNSLRGLHGIIDNCEEGSYITGYEGETIKGVIKWINKVVYEAK